MRLTPAIPVAIIALFGGGLVAISADAADSSRTDGFPLAAGSSSVPSDTMHGTAPHTGTGLGQEKPPAEDMKTNEMSPSPVTNPAAPDDVQGTAPHTGTGLGQEMVPPPQTPSMRDSSKALESPSGTSEGNVSKPEKKMGEKPSP